jgi:hypothetical protein
VVRENGLRMIVHDLIFKHFMVTRILVPFAGPLRRTVPAIFQTATEVTEEIPQAGKGASIIHLKKFSSFSGSQCFSGINCPDPPLNFGLRFASSQSMG